MEIRNTVHSSVTRHVIPSNITLLTRPYHTTTGRPQTFQKTVIVPKLYSLSWQKVESRNEKGHFSSFWFTLDRHQFFTEQLIFTGSTVYRIYEYKLIDIHFQISQKLSTVKKTLVSVKMSNIPFGPDEHVLILKRDWNKEIFSLNYNLIIWLESVCQCYWT